MRYLLASLLTFLPLRAFCGNGLGGANGTSQGTTLNTQTTMLPDQTNQAGATGTEKVKRDFGTQEDVTVSGTCAAGMTGQNCGTPIGNLATTQDPFAKPATLVNKPVDPAAFGSAIKTLGSSLVKDAGNEVHRDANLAPAPVLDGGKATAAIGDDLGNAQLASAAGGVTAETFDIEQAQTRDATPGMAPVWKQIGSLSTSDPATAMATARQALAQHPEDRQLQAYVQLAAKPKDPAVQEKTIKDRAKELLASLRGDPGEAPPPGAAILASPLPFASMGAAGGAGPMSAAAMSAAGLNAARGGVMRGASPMVRDAAGKYAIRDFPGAQALLDRRLAENPSDEPALHLRAITFRQMKRYPASASDAKAALTLAPWDSGVHHVLIDDQVDMGQSAEALSEADRALQASPNDAQILVARANVYASLGEKEKELADLKEAAALDAQFDQLYQRTLLGDAAPIARRPRSGLVWLGAIGTALLFFSFALFRKRGDSSVRLAMRADDHALLARGARPDAAPAGFRIVKTLGQGGMGVVYEAVDLGLQRTVALKKLRAEIADSPRERARFLKEARTVAGLKHPNIVEIHAIHEDAEGLFLVFEKIDGESLHERLGHGALRPGEAVGYLRQIAMALDHAHTAGVVHQDLKPANVMVSGDRAKVMDFGIARRVQETMSTLSRIEVAGTPAYMAPEQERGGAVGPAADVFALGACAYELLTGRTPFPNGGMMMKAEKMYRPASEVAPSVPKTTDAVIARALEPEPGARWPSAASFVDALARSLS